MNDLDRELAELAGYTLGWAEMWEGDILSISETPTGPYANYPAAWFSPDCDPLEDDAPPAYTEFIDPQHRDLDPLIEAKWGPFSEKTEPWGRIDWFRTGLVSHDGSRFVYGEGPKRASARAAACAAALRAEKESE